jgi:hypothetical protein
LIDANGLAVFHFFLFSFFIFIAYRLPSGRGRFALIRHPYSEMMCVRIFSSIRNLCRWWAVRPYWASSATTIFVTSDAVAVRWVTRRTPSRRRASSVNSTTVASWTNGSN